jgi:vancomycin resistance protein YoaR
MSAGGVCQVSTTIFRAALNAGMPITEWYPHTYRLANYEFDGWSPGFDASILQFGPDPAAWPDFEFENYTDGWLLIEAYTEYPYVHVNIYGSGDGRTVTLDPIALGGNAFGFIRTIYDANGNVIATRQFESYYM